MFRSCFYIKQAKIWVTDTDTVVCACVHSGKNHHATSEFVSCEL